MQQRQFFVRKRPDASASAHIHEKERRLILFQARAKGRVGLSLARNTQAMPAKSGLPKGG